MNTANIDYTNTGCSHTHNYYQRGKFKKDIEIIEEKKTYTIQEICPNGKIIQTSHIPGREIKKDYLEIFQKDRHGFIIIEEGMEPRILFVYNGIVADLVNNILKKTIH